MSRASAWRAHSRDSSRRRNVDDQERGRKASPTRLRMHRRCQREHGVVRVWCARISEVDGCAADNIDGQPQQTRPISSCVSTVCASRMRAGCERHRAQHTHVSTQSPPCTSKASCSAPRSGKQHAVCVKPAYLIARDRSGHEHARTRHKKTNAEANKR